MLASWHVPLEIATPETSPTGAGNMAKKQHTYARAARKRKAAQARRAREREQNAAAAEAKPARAVPAPKE
jgi:hypothetical protein